MHRRIIAMMIIAIMAVTVFGCGGTETQTQSKEESPKPKAVLEVRDVNYKNRSGVVRFTGVVANKSPDIKANRVTIEAIVTDLQDTEIGSSLVDVGELAPGASRPFVIEVEPTGGPEEIKYKVTAFEEEEL